MFCREFYFEKVSSLRPKSFINDISPDMNQSLQAFEIFSREYERLDIYEKRIATDQSIELVFCNKDLDQWLKLLTDAFGPAIKSPGANPSREDQTVTKEYGGIRTDQTLFRSGDDNMYVIAMLWPWLSAKFTTLKVILVSKKY